MNHNFFPKHYVASAYDIPYEKLYSDGKRAIIFDIDNTLVEHGAPADARAIKLIQRLKDIGFQICFLSNNKEPRVKTFNEPLQASYIHKAGKPKKAGYFKAMEQMESNVETTVFIGDQIFTDVWGANRAGIETYLTEPISKKEEIQIVLKRYLEKPILFCYKKMSKRKYGKIL